MRVCVALLLVILPRLGRAQPAPTPSSADLPSFGGAGQIVPSGGVGLFWSTIRAPSGSSDDTTDVSVSIAPSLDYFVVPHVSVGGGLAVGGYSGKGVGGYADSGRLYGVAVRGGYDLVLAPRVSLWSVVSLRYSKRSDTVTAPASAAGTLDETIVSVEVFAPLLFHPARHLFIGFGPLLWTDLSASRSSDGVTSDTGKETQLGLQSTIGGWFDL